MTVGKLRRGSVGLGIDDHHPVSHAPRLDGEHPAELPATKNSQGAAGEDHAMSGRMLVRMRFSSAARNASSRVASAASVPASIAMAKSAAL